MTTDDQAARDAAKLFKCKYKAPESHCDLWETEQRCEPCQARPAVAAALRERDAQSRLAIDENAQLRDIRELLKADVRERDERIAALEAAYALKVEDFAAETLRFSTLIERLREHGHREQPWPTDCWICRLMAQACGQEPLSATTPAERERDALEAENGRLREALTMIANPTRDFVGWWTDKARAVLAEVKRAD